MRDGGATETGSWYLCLSARARKNTPLDILQLLGLLHHEKDIDAKEDDAQRRAEQAQPTCAESQLPRC